MKLGTITGENYDNLIITNKDVLKYNDIFAIYMRESNTNDVVSILELTEEELNQLNYMVSNYQK